MEKIDEVLKGDRLKKILEKSGCKTTEEYLKKQGFVKYPELGWIIEERLQECINKGLIGYDEEKGVFALTVDGCKYKTLCYVGGVYPKLYVRRSGEGIEDELDTELYEEGITYEEI